MNSPRSREYRIEIDPRILELLGPSLYTNIYYVLAELIANAYDAEASNVYIIEKGESIVVEDDGAGMSYAEGDIDKYLNVAAETRTTDDDIYTAGKKRRKRMGRKGVGKLAALSVSEKVLVMTKKKGEASGFVLSRHVGNDRKLEPIDQQNIVFEKIKKDGTSIVMTKPEYGLHKTPAAIKKNMVKIFPLVDADFRIHILKDGKEDPSMVIDSFDKEMIGGLGALIILGKEFHHLARHFDSGLEKKDIEEDLLKKEESKKFTLSLKNKQGVTKDYDLEIKGWIGAYKSTSGRKVDRDDFPDNFISLLSNRKLGEYNVIPAVGRNYLQEVYLVGQLHVDLFEETELPDMALSNRQGYKTEDERYRVVIDYIRKKLLPQIIEMRVVYASQVKAQREKAKYQQRLRDEEKLREKFEEYKSKAAAGVAKELESTLHEKMPSDTKETIEKQMEKLSPLVGLKKKVDAQKKKILISHTGADKALADVIYKMLSFNDVPDSDIIYTNSDSEDCWIPGGANIFDYLRNFFVDSISDKKIFVIYVTSDDMSKSWNAVSEVGAGWITQSQHRVFNVHDHSPQQPLNVGIQWHTSKKTGTDISMNAVACGKFAVCIMDICRQIGYTPKSKTENLKELKKLVTVAVK